MKRVLKYAIPVDDQDHPIPAGCVAHVNYSPENPTSTVMVWVEVPQNVDLGLLAVRVYGTGHAIDDNDEHLGSTITPVGLVWHLYGRRIGQ